MIPDEVIWTGCACAIVVSVALCYALVCYGTARLRESQWIETVEDDEKPAPLTPFDIDPDDPGDWWKYERPNN